jgi:hypothetical protein
MVIFLLWLGLVCCGVANGLVYDHVQAPQSYYYMVISSIVAVILLVVHRVYTRNWYDPIDEIDDHHSSVFSGSAVILFIVTLSSLFAVHTGEVSWGFFVACTTMLLSFCIATIKERSYV